MQTLGPTARAMALALAAVLAGCGGGASPTPESLPSPTCGGLKILIQGALPCERVVEIAVGALAARSPEQLARGIAAIDVVLATCPRNEMPPQIDCGNERFAQLVTVTFASQPQGGPIEPSLTVAVAPVSGAVLGISNPLIL